MEHDHKLYFPELGHNQFVELRDMKKFSWKRKKAIIQAFKDESVNSQLDSTEMVAMMMIKSGYILDEDNQPISFPLNEESVGNLPSVVIEEVVKHFGEAMQPQDKKN